MTVPPLAVASVEVAALRAALADANRQHLQDTARIHALELRVSRLIGTVRTAQLNVAGLSQHLTSLAKDI